MSAKSNDQGRAYEFAWLNILNEELSKKFKTTIIKNSSYETNKSAWDKIISDPENYAQTLKIGNGTSESIKEYLHDIFSLSASSAIESIFELEPLLTESEESLITLELQKDKEGVEGDVRDIVIRRNDISWEFGLSIKHNHDAISHNRLSRKIDFGKKWYDQPCSQKYWQDVIPIFDKLDNFKSNCVKWDEINDKSQEIYIPLLNAFKDEVLRAYKICPELPKRIVEFLIGIKDYYKIISHDRERMTIIRTFNMNGTLNKCPRGVKVAAKTVPLLKMPTRLVELDFKENSDTTLEMILNNGWQLSFRMHNASTYVEPSLKFDIQFVGTPTTIFSIVCRWKRL